MYICGLLESYALIIHSDAHGAPAVASQAWAPLPSPANLPRHESYPRPAHLFSPVRFSMHCISPGIFSVSMIPLQPCYFGPGKVFFSSPKQTCRFCAPAISNRYEAGPPCFHIAAWCQFRLLLTQCAPVGGSALACRSRTLGKKTQIATK